MDVGIPTGDQVWCCSSVLRVMHHVPYATAHDGFLGLKRIFFDFSNVTKDKACHDSRLRCHRSRASSPGKAIKDKKSACAQDLYSAFQEILHAEPEFLRKLLDPSPLHIFWNFTAMLTYAVSPCAISTSAAPKIVGICSSDFVLFEQPPT